MPVISGFIHSFHAVRASASLAAAAVIARATGRTSATCANHTSQQPQSFGCDERRLSPPRGRGAGRRASLSLTAAEAQPYGTGAPVGTETIVARNVEADARGICMKSDATRVLRNADCPPIDGSL